jgi:hypothetical protein
LDGILQRIWYRDVIPFDVCLNLETWTKYGIRRSLRRKSTCDKELKAELQGRVVVPVDENKI